MSLTRSVQVRLSSRDNMSDRHERHLNTSEWHSYPFLRRYCLDWQQEEDPFLPQVFLSNARYYIHLIGFFQIENHFLYNESTLPFPDPMVEAWAETSEQLIHRNEKGIKWTDCHTWSIPSPFWISCAEQLQNDDHCRLFISIRMQMQAPFAKGTRPAGLTRRRKSASASLQPFHLLQESPYLKWIKVTRVNYNKLKWGKTNRNRTCTRKVSGSQQGGNVKCAAPLNHILFHSIEVPLCWLQIDSRLSANIKMSFFMNKVMTFHLGKLSSCVHIFQQKRRISFEEDESRIRLRGFVVPCFFLPPNVGFWNVPWPSNSVSSKQKVRLAFLVKKKGHKASHTATPFSSFGGISGIQIQSG